MARLAEMSPDLRGCAILDADGRALAASGDRERWGSAGAALLAAADAAGDEPAAQVHVATEEARCSRSATRGSRWSRSPSASRSPR